MDMGFSPRDPRAHASIGKHTGWLLSWLTGGYQREQAATNYDTSVERMRASSQITCSWARHVRMLMIVVATGVGER